MATILVVEDEPEVRDLIAELLTRLGYQVLVAACGGEALRVFHGKTAISLVITDVRMPGMTGLELADAVKRQSSIPVLLMSGHRREALDVSADLPLLEKPFTNEELTTKIREMLGKR